MVVGGLVTKSCTTLVTPCTVAHQAPQCIRFSRQEYWSGLPFPSPGDLPNPGIEPGSPAWELVSCISDGFFTSKPHKREDHFAYNKKKAQGESGHLSDRICPKKGDGSSANTDFTHWKRWRLLCAKLFFLKHCYFYNSVFWGKGLDLKSNMYCYWSKFGSPPLLTVKSIY